MSDSYLFAIGWVFFATWTALVFVVSLAAFGQDLFPSLLRAGGAQGTSSPDRATPGESAR
jgi:hypothetical protein